MNKTNLESECVSWDIDYADIVFEHKREDPNDDTLHVTKLSDQSKNQTDEEREEINDKIQLEIVNFTFDYNDLKQLRDTVKEAMELINYRRKERGFKPLK